MKERQTHIDLLECIAIFFVVVYHTILYSCDIWNDKSISNYCSYFFNTILSTCVPLFFFANGYLLFNREFCLKKHIIKIIRFIAITFIWAFIYLLFYLPLKGEPYSLRNFVFGILNMKIEYGLNVMWFMGAIVCIYILFPALKALFDNSKKSFISFVIICAVFTFGIVMGQEVSDILTALFNHRVSIVNHDAIKMFNPFKGMFGYSVVYFCIGGLAFSFEKKIINVIRWKRNTIAIIGLLISCAMLFALGLFYSNFSKKTWDVVWYGYDTIFTFFNVVFIYILSLNFKKNNAFIKLISCNTLGIYFIHDLFIPFSKPWLETIPFLTNIPCSILYASLILLASLGISVLIKKIPIIKKLGIV